MDDGLTPGTTVREADDGAVPQRLDLHFAKVFDLARGSAPGRAAALYRFDGACSDFGPSGPSVAAARRVNGAPPSWETLLDAAAAWGAVRCGVAGAVVAVNRPVISAFVERLFAAGWPIAGLVAPSFKPDALLMLGTHRDVCALATGVGQGVGPGLALHPLDGGGWSWSAPAPMRPAGWGRTAAAPPHACRPKGRRPTRASPRGSSRPPGRTPSPW